MRRFRKGAAVIVPAALAAALALAPAAGGDRGGAVFEGQDTLLRPDGYREWVFVGSSLGLRYDEKDDKPPPGPEEYKTVYIEPAAYRAYRETGRFPPGTVLVLEAAAAEAKREPGLRGSYQGEMVGLLAAVKDPGRFDNGWAYFRFTEGPGKLSDRARPFPKGACYDCHRQRGGRRQRLHAVLPGAAGRPEEVSPVAGRRRARGGLREPGARPGLS